MSENPFAVLTLIGAPAILTNASSLLALGTSNRFARAVDRQRQLSTLIERDGNTMSRDEAALRLRQLRRAELRGQLLLRALTSVYLSLGAFAAASLLSLIGAIVGAAIAYVTPVAAILAIFAGLAGIGGIVSGSILLVRETRVALESLKEEAAFTKHKFSQRDLEPGEQPI